MHALLETYVFEMDRNTRFHHLIGQLGVVVVFKIDSLPELVGPNRSDRFAAFVEQRFVVSVYQLAAPVSFEDGPEDPSMAVKVRELRARKLLVEFRCARSTEEVRVRPKTTQRRGFRVAIQ